MMRVSAAWLASTTATTSAAAVGTAVPPLLRYSIRKAAASEMLYGGVRIQHLVQPAFPLQKIKSEELPSPSLERERHDLGLEMRMPKDVLGYDRINIAIERQVGENEVDAEGEATQGFSMGKFFSDAHHPERHHNSSLPYSARDTNNVLALRLFPVNIHIRHRTEAVRVRTEDCLQRLRDAKLCQGSGITTEYPLPLALRHSSSMSRRREETLYSGAIDPAKLTVSNGDAGSAEAKTFAHLRGADYHPKSSELSIFTRPVDRQRQGYLNNKVSANNSSASFVPLGTLLFGARASGTLCSAQSWMPLQVLKPIGSTWSASMRSSGTRGPHMQLMQERLDQKGFGWKKKSRSLWQQDIATAGFRPHRYF